MIISSSSSASRGPEPLGPSYDDIAQFNLRDCAPDPIAPPMIPGDAQSRVRYQRHMLLRVSERLRRSTAFRILGVVERGAGPNRAAQLIDRKVWRNLDLICGSEHNPTSYLASLLNKTHTDLGRAFFTGLIARPSAQVNKLRSRQELIKGLLSAGLLDELSEQFRQMAATEAQLLSMWDDKMQLPPSVQEQFSKYHPRMNAFINRNPRALDVHVGVQYLEKIVALVTQAASTILLPLYILGLTGAWENPPLLEDYALRFVGTPGPIYSLFSLISNRFFHALSVLGAAAFAALVLPGAVRWLNADAQMDRIVQHKLAAVADFFRRAKAVHGLLLEHPEMTDKLELFPELKRLQVSRALRRLMQVLETPTFNGRAGYFFQRGNVLVAWSQLRDRRVQRELAPVLAALGEIEAYLSAARLYAEHKETAQGFCFPRYLCSSQSPRLQMERFWNVFVPPDRVVANSLRLGGKGEASHAIVTGPNASGKSTMLRSAATAILLAQSLGIAPAREMALTPFQVLGCSMNISDDLKAGRSLFQAQIDDMVQLRARLRNLPRRQFSFVVLDELFTGTTAQEGSAIEHAVVEELGEHPNVLSMVVTHGEAPKRLARRNPRYRNFKLSTDSRSYQPLYRLQPGASDLHIALKVAQQRGLGKDLLERAEQLLQN